MTGALRYSRKIFFLGLAGGAWGSGAVLRPDRDSRAGVGSGLGAGSAGRGSADPAAAGRGSAGLGAAGRGGTGLGAAGRGVVGAGSEGVWSRLCSRPASTFCPADLRGRRRRRFLGAPAAVAGGVSSPAPPVSSQMDDISKSKSAGASGCATTGGAGREAGMDTVGDASLMATRGNGADNTAGVSSAPAPDDGAGETGTTDARGVDNSGPDSKSSKTVSDAPCAVLPGFLRLRLRRRFSPSGRRPSSRGPGCASRTGRSRS